jgi:hypothetical protein
MPPRNYNYGKEVTAFIKLKCETNNNNNAIARQVKKAFDIPQELDAVRRHISFLRKREDIKAKAKPMKRLFFDIETTYMKGWFWRCGKQYIGPANIMEDKKIICISYKWWGENKVHTLKWDKKQNDKKMIKEFIKIMGQADELIAHNGDKFDIKEIRARAIKQGLLMYPTYRTLDTLKKARQYFNFASNKLDYLGQFLNIGGKLSHDGIKMWMDIVENNCQKALDKMVQYCEQDVALLEDVYTQLAPYIWHNTNFAVLTGGNKWECPECASVEVEEYHTYTTPMGVIRRNMRCQDCNKQYRVSNKTYMDMLVNKHQENYESN